MEYFEKRVFLGVKIKKSPIYRNGELKTVGGVGFEMTGNVTFQESVFYDIYYRKINNYTSRTNRRHESVDIACISK